VAYLQVEGLSFSYEKHRKVLKDISFSVEKGRCLCIAGANGSGKSTLLELLASCMKPSAGSITIGGVPLSYNGELSAVSPVPGLLGNETFLQSIGLELPLCRFSLPPDAQATGAQGPH
jgi:ABC-type cobalamin/Fe3+-siderophores transport system ATPase subunit